MNPLKVIEELEAKCAALEAELAEARKRPARIARPGEDLLSKQAQNAFDLIRVEEERDAARADLAIACEALEHIGKGPLKACCSKHWRTGSENNDLHGHYAVVAATALDHIRKARRKAGG